MKCHAALIESLLCAPALRGGGAVQPFQQHVARIISLIHQMLSLSLQSRQQLVRVTQVVVDVELEHSQISNPRLSTTTLHCESQARIEAK